jgi:hypothetical protein
MSEAVFIDWRGNPIRIGDTVLKPRPVAEMVEYKVLDLYRTHRLDGQKWVRLAPDAPEPENGEVVWRARLQPLRSSRLSAELWPKPTFFQQTCSLTFLATDPTKETNP